MSKTQIAAFITTETKRLLDAYAAENGFKKGHLIEQALLHHLRVLREQPSRVVPPPVDARQTLAHKPAGDVSGLEEMPVRQP